jgi:hypothetical protein
MNRDQIIETMAMSLAVGRGRIAAGPRETKDAERALTAVLPMIRAEIAAKDARISELVLMLDRQFGTPCEQIRHRQEIENLRAFVLEEAAAIRAMKGDGT